MNDIQLQKNCDKKLLELENKNKDIKTRMNNDKYMPVDNYLYYERFHESLEMIHNVLDNINDRLKRIEDQQMTNERTIK